METKEIATRSEDILTETKQIEIRDDVQYQAAAEMLKQIKALQKELDAYFDPAISKAYQAHRAMLAAKKKQSEPLKSAENLLKQKIGEYARELERRRREEQERLRKLAEERRLREAIETGDDTLLDEAVIVPELPQRIERLEGISVAETWKFRIVDETRIPQEYLMPDEKKIGQVVRALKQNTSIPGVEVYAEDVVSARAAS